MSTAHPTTTTEPQPAPPVDDGEEDNWGGWRAPITCINHPGRETVGTIDTNGICYECVEVELLRHRLWLRSFGVVRGGVEALRP